MDSRHAPVNNNETAIPEVSSLADAAVVRPLPIRLATLMWRIEIG